MFRNSKQAQQGGRPAGAHTKLHVFLSASDNPKMKQELAQLALLQVVLSDLRGGHPGTEGAPGCPMGGAECCCPGWWGLQVA